VICLRARHNDITSWNWLKEPISETLAAARLVNIRRSVSLLLAVGATLSGTGQMVSAQGVRNSGPLLAQAAAPLINEPRLTQPTPGVGTTILPTDVLPLPTIQNRMTFGENLQLRVLQKLPARFYFTSTVETSWRYETNIFQSPKKSIFVRQLATDPETNQYSFLRLNALVPPDPITPATSLRWEQTSQQLAIVNREDRIFRVLPNVTAGFAITPRTRVFANYFMIRDSLWDNTRLNTTIQSLAYGVQKDIPIGQRANLQLEMQARSLFQAHQEPLFDFLPGITFSMVATPRTVLFVNALAQMRGKFYMQAPTRELDPFYTWGALHQRGGWSFSASTTFVQNFREPFASNASIPINNYSFISDFEVARRLFRQLPGLQAFIRAEPIWNMEAHNRFGLSGTDFRLYTGIRMSLTKPALTTALDSLRRQLEEQEVAPPSAPGSSPNKPSAHIPAHQVIANTPQPIHGFLTEAGTADEVANAAAGSLTPIKLTPAQQIADGELQSSPEVTPVSAAVGLTPDESDSTTAL
jgi:hypothetical protein